MIGKFETAGVVLTGAAMVTGGLVALLVRFAPQIGLMDRPNERSLHKKVTPRGGGLGFVLVMALALSAMLVAGDVMEHAGVSSRLTGSLGAYLGASLFIAAVSLRDDFKSLGSGIRFFCQIGAAVAAVVVIGGFEAIAMPGGGVLPLGWAGPLLTMVWIVGLTNVYNFMDGVDGIAGVQGLIAALAWMFAGVWMDSAMMLVIGALLAGGCAGFLIHNWSPAKIFMGDVGSAFLGYTFAVLPLLALKEMTSGGGGAAAGLVPVFAALVVWPFIGDGFLTFVRRARQGETVWTPHRSHLYQRLAQSGWTHAQVSALYALWCAVSAAVALGWMRSGGAWVALAGVAGFALISLGAMLVFVTQREERRRVRHA